MHENRESSSAQVHDTMSAEVANPRIDRRDDEVATSTLLSSPTRALMAKNAVSKTTPPNVGKFQPESQQAFSLRVRPVIPENQTAPAFSFQPHKLRELKFSIPKIPQHADGVVQTIGQGEKVTGDQATQTLSHESATIRCPPSQVNVQNPLTFDISSQSRVPTDNPPREKEEENSRFLSTSTTAKAPSLRQSLPSPKSYRTIQTIPQSFLSKETSYSARNHRSCPSEERDSNPTGGTLEKHDKKIRQTSIEPALESQNCNPAKRHRHNLDQVDPPILHSHGGAEIVSGDPPNSQDESRKRPKTKHQHIRPVEDLGESGEELCARLLSELQYRKTLASTAHGRVEALSQDVEAYIEAYNDSYNKWRSAEEVCKSQRENLEKYRKAHKYWQSKFSDYKKFMAGFQNDFEAQVSASKKLGQEIDSLRSSEKVMKADIADALRKNTEGYDASASARAKALEGITEHAIEQAKIQQLEKNLRDALTSANEASHQLTEERAKVSRLEDSLMRFSQDDGISRRLDEMKNLIRKDMEDGQADSASHFAECKKMIQSLANKAFACSSDIDELKGALSILTSDIKSRSGIIDVVKASVDVIETGFVDLKALLEKKDQAILRVSELQKTCGDLQRRVHDSERDLIIAGHAMNEKNKDNDRLKRQILNMSVELAAYEEMDPQAQTAQNESLDGQIASLQDSLKGTTQVISTISASLRITNGDLRTATEALQSLKNEKVEAATKSDDQIEDLQEELEEANANRNRLESCLEDSRLKMETFMHQYQRLWSAVKRLKKKQQQLETEDTRRKDFLNSDAIKDSEDAHAANVQFWRESSGHYESQLRETEEKLSSAQNSISGLKSELAQKDAQVKKMEDCFGAHMSLEDTFRRCNFLRLEESLNTLTLAKVINRLEERLEIPIEDGRPKPRTPRTPVKIIEHKVHESLGIAAPSKKIDRTGVVHSDQNFPLSSSSLSVHRSSDFMSLSPPLNESPKQHATANKVRRLTFENPRASASERISSLEDAADIPERKVEGTEGLQKPRSKSNTDRVNLQSTDSGITSIGRSRPSSEQNGASVDAIRENQGILKTTGPSGRRKRGSEEGSMRANAKRVRVQAPSSYGSGGEGAPIAAEYSSLTAAYSSTAARELSNPIDFPGTNEQLPNLPKPKARTSATGSTPQSRSGQVPGRRVSSRDQQRYDDRFSNEGPYAS